MDSLARTDTALREQMLPKLARLGAILTEVPGFRLESGADIPMETNARAAHELGMTLRALEVRDRKDIESAFAVLTQESPDALIVLQDALTLQHRTEVIDFAIQKHLPGMFVAEEWVEVGGLMSYGESLSDMYQRGAYFVEKIFKGTKPADLPVEQVTKFELILNLKTAKAIGLAVHPCCLFARTR